MNTSRFKPLLISALVAAAVSPLTTQAAGFALQEQSASLAGTAFAGKSAAGEDASANWFNPASISRLKRQEIVVGAHVISVNAKFKDDGTSRDAFESAGNNGGSIIDPAFIPNFHYVRPINEKMNFGFSVAVPFGLATKYDRQWVGRFQGVDSEIKTIDLNPSLSYRVDENLSVGAGVSVQYLQAKLTQATAYPGGREGTAEIKGDNIGYGYNVGALLQIGPSTRVGLAWRSEIKHSLDGSVRFTGNTFSPELQGQTADGGLRSTITLPGTLSLSSVTNLNEQWDLLTDATWTQWSKIQELSFTRTDNTDAQAIPTTVFKWRDTMRYAVGFTRQMSQKTKVKFGVAYDETPVSSDLRGVRLPDENRLMFSLGSQYQLDENCRIDISGTYFKAKKAQIDDDLGNRNMYGLVSGEYKADAFILSAQFSHRF